jgi:putative transposase
MEYKELNILGPARGYFTTSSGNVTDEVILEYIQKQEIEENQRSDNFTIE